MQSVIAIPAAPRDTPRSSPVLSDDAIRELVDNLRSVAVARLDLSGRILSWNHGAERILGYAPAHAVGRHLTSLLTPDDIARGLAERLVRDAASSGETQHDGWYVRQDGTRVWVHAVVAAIRRLDGALTGFGLVLRERGDTLEAEAHLRNTQARLHAILDQLPFGVVLAEAPSGRLTYGNHRAVEIVGLRTLPAATLAEAAQATAFHQRGAPVQADEWPVARALAKGEPSRDFQTRFVRADGRELWLRVDAAPLRTDGRITGAVVILTDVTEPRAAGERLRASEERFRGLAAASPVGVFHADLDGRFAYANPRMETLWRMSAAELAGGGWLTRVHPHDREPMIARWAAASVRGEDHEHELRVQFPDGEVRWMHLRAAVLRDAGGRPAGTAGTVEDVTDRVRATETVERATEALREREEHLSAIVESAPVGVGFLDGALRFRQVNDRLAEMHGVAPAAHVGRRLREVVPDHDPRFAEEARRVLETDAPGFLTLTGITPAHPDAVRTFNVAFHPLHGRGGRTLGVGIVVEEVTDRRRTELVLEASERRARALAEQPGVGVLGLSEGRIVECSEAFAGMLGVPREELVGREILPLTHPGDRVTLTRETRALAIGAAASARVDMRFLRFNGTILWTELSLVAVRDEAGRPAVLLGVAQDVSSRHMSEAALRASEERLRRALAAAASGPLGGDAAHGLADQLSAALLSVELAQSAAHDALGDVLETALSPSDLSLGEMVGQLDAAARAASGAADFARRLVAPPRPVTGAEEQCDVPSAVRRAEPLLRRQVGDEAVLALRLEDGLWPVRASAPQVEQLLAQLVAAGRDGLPAGGTISIEAVNLEATQGARIPPGDYVALSLLAVADTESGRDRAPRPLFRGGAGQAATSALAPLQPLAARIGGFVQLDGTPGRGGAVQIYLPRAAAPSSGNPMPIAYDSVAVVPVAGGTRVMLVEDDAAVRLAVRRTLERNGYAVLEAANGIDALALWRDRGHEVDVLLADAHMPSLDGIGLAAMLRTERPDLPVVLAAWQPGESGAGAAPDPTIVPLEKPLRGESLLQAVRRALAR